MGLVQSLGSDESPVTQASITLTLTAATTAGDTIVVSAIQASANGFTSVTDSRGNVYTKEAQTSVGTSQTIASFMAIGAAALAAGDTITLTSAVSNQYPVIDAYEFTPVSGRADASTSATDAGTSSSTYAIPGVPIPPGDHLLIGVVGESGAGRSQTPSGTWIKLGANGAAAPTFPRTVMSMWDTANGGTLAASGTFSGSGRWCGHLLAFPVASSSSVFPVSGVTAAVSGVAGAVTALLLAAGTLAGVSSTTGTVTALRPVSAVTAATSDTTGTVTVLHVVQGATTAQSETTGSPTALLHVSGTTAAVSDTSGTVTVTVGPATIPVTGTIPAVSGTAGTVTLLAAASGSTDATSTTVGDVTLLAQVSGNTDAVSGTTGSPINPSRYRDLDITYTTSPDRWTAATAGPRWQATTGHTRWGHDTGTGRWDSTTSPDRWE
jgi:hypothetical protein